MANCKFCGATNLHWPQPYVKGVSKLVDSQGRKHLCDSSLDANTTQEPDGLELPDFSLPTAPVISMSDDARITSALSKADAASRMALQMTSEVAVIGQRVNQAQQEMVAGISMIGTQVDSLDAKWQSILATKQQVEFITPEHVSYTPEGTVHKSQATLVKALYADGAVYIRGGAGGGKSTAASLASNIMHLPFFELHIGPMTNDPKIYGFNNMATGEYVGTPVRRWCEEGGVLCLDEVDAGTPGLNTLLNPIVEVNTRLVSFPDRMVEKHKDCYVIATANTYGLGADAVYIGRNPQDGAFLDRFSVLNWDYDWNFVDALAGNYEWSRHVRRVHERIVELGKLFVVGPRAAIQGARLLAAGFTWEEASEMRIWARIPSDARREIERGL